MRSNVLLVVMCCGGLSAETPAPAAGIDVSAMDRRANPCTDFYRYSCGAWVKANPIPPDQSGWGILDAVYEKNLTVLKSILETAGPQDQQIGDYYAACMNEAALEARGAQPARPLLDEIAALSSKLEVTGMLVKLQRVGIAPFFDFRAEQDFKDATRVIAVVDQGGLTLPDRDYYLKTDAKSAEIREKLAAYVEKMFVLAGASDAARKAQTVLRIETELARGSLDVVSRRDPAKIYHNYSVAELISLEPGLDWAKFFEGVGAASVQRLNVAYPPFMRRIESITVQSSLDEIKTYLSWRVLDALAPVLSSSFENENWRLHRQVLLGVEKQKPRWKRCVQSTDQMLADALGKRFVEKSFGDQGKQRTLEMVNRLEAAMRRDIESLEWMTPATKQQALTKLSAITNKIGFPDRWRDYSSVRVTREDAAGNYLRLRAWVFDHDTAKIGKPVDKLDWDISAPTLNAFYNPQMNDITFPAGILQPPLYSNAAADAANYGGIGAVIGHELTHGFDDEGRLFDGQGNWRDWWTEADSKQFEQRSACFVSQYAAYSPVAGVTVNGKLTLGENVADSGGLRIAQMAFAGAQASRPDKRANGLTAAQQFFVAFGQLWCGNVRPESMRMRAMVDPHSPNEFRVNGVVRNNAEFQRAFSCKPIADACRIW